MLGSITSLGERSRGRFWAVTYSWFVLGALVGGLALGVLLIAVRQLGDLLPQAVTLSAGIAGLVAVTVAVALGRTPPSPERQVDHRWLDTFRGWVVGAGFGFQLGVGVVTRIPSFALYIVALCALLGASWPGLVVAGVAYAAVRALSAAPGGWITDPGRLRRVVGYIDRVEPRAAAAGRMGDLAAAGAVLAVLIATVP